MKSLNFQGLNYVRPPISFSDMSIDIPNPIYVNGASVKYCEDGAAEILLTGKAKTNLFMLPYILLPPKTAERNRRAFRIKQDSTGGGRVSARAG